MKKVMLVLILVSAMGAMSRSADARPVVPPVVQEKVKVEFGEGNCNIGVNFVIPKGSLARLDYNSDCDGQHYTFYQTAGACTIAIRGINPLGSPTLRDYVIRVEKATPCGGPGKLSGTAVLQTFGD